MLVYKHRHLPLEKLYRYLGNRQNHVADIVITTIAVLLFAEIGLAFPSLHFDISDLPK
jgi:hypothetical protein